MFLLMAGSGASAEPWGGDVSAALTVDGPQLGVNTRYQWSANEVTAGLRAYPPGLPSPAPAGGQIGYRYHFKGGKVRPLLGPEYQMMRHRGGTLHALFWAYGISVPFNHGFVLEQTIGMGGAYLYGAPRAAVEPDVLLRLTLVFRSGW